MLDLRNVSSASIKPHRDSCLSSLVFTMPLSSLSIKLIKCNKLIFIPWDLTPTPIPLCELVWLYDSVLWKSRDWRFKRKMANSKSSTCGTKMHKASLKIASFVRALLMSYGSSVAAGGYSVGRASRAPMERLCVLSFNLLVKDGKGIMAKSVDDIHSCTWRNLLGLNLQ